MIVMQRAKDGVFVAVPNNLMYGRIWLCNQCLNQYCSDEESPTCPDCRTPGTLVEVPSVIKPDG